MQQVRSEQYSTNPHLGYPDPYNYGYQYDPNRPPPSYDPNLPPTSYQPPVAAYGQPNYRNIPSQGYNDPNYNPQGDNYSRPPPSSNNYPYPIPSYNPGGPDGLLGYQKDDAQTRINQIIEKHQREPPVNSDYNPSRPTDSHASYSPQSSSNQNSYSQNAPKSTSQNYHTPYDPSTQY